MARKPRFDLPGQPQHVIQRGNNKTPVFAETEDYLFYRECLRTASERHCCSIHAYVLMTNHVHLLVSPGERGGISRLMQSVGRRYVRRFNDNHGRTGTLWEGRFRATAIADDEYLFNCLRYIEENPVRAGMVGHPSRYRWSSFAANALGAEDPLIRPHERYLALGPSPRERQGAYRAIFAAPLQLAETESIRTGTRFSWALGRGQSRL